MFLHHAGWRLKKQAALKLIRLHLTGDLVLKTIATICRQNIRGPDSVARWGGEEFIAVLPATGAAGAAEVAERMRAGIANTTFNGIGEGTTISLGVATLSAVDDPTTAWDALVKEADQFLYQAKNQGRNRVVSSLE